MGIALIKMKIMPESLDSDLNKIKIKIQKILVEKGARGIGFEERPIAFGLKALISSFNIDESEELDPIEQAISKIPHVKSAQVEDMRRGLG
ncbi:MAG: elongation factor 1-beta [Nanoarchaeota archaeon]